MPDHNRMTTEPRVCPSTLPIVAGCDPTPSPQSGWAPQAGTGRFPLARRRAIWQADGMRVLILIAALGTPAHAQMSAEDFDAYTRGHTLYYGAGGQAYGGEEYLDNRRVRWSFLDGECQEGYWYEQDDLICFVYENRPDPQCWSFERTGSGLIARFSGETVMSELYEVERSSEPLMCLGPRIGV